MTKIAVLGAGMVGRAIALDLAADHQVTSFDISDESLAILGSINSSIIRRHTDLQDYSSYQKMLNGFDVVVSAVPGFMGFKTLQQIIHCRKNVVDISFFPENALDLNELAKQNDVTAIVDCGVAPGMSNLILGYENSRMKIKSFECLVGGLPKTRIQPFEYKAPFSPIDVIEEYTRPARYIENGHLVTRPALTDVQSINFNKVGTLESFNTDGLRSILYTMDHIPFLKEKTLRYPGHVALMKALISAGFFNILPLDVDGTSIIPLHFTNKILFKQWKLEQGEPEFTIMRIVISGHKDEQPKTVTYTLYDEYNELTRTSSMARTTGYTCTAAVNMVLNKMFEKKGVFPPELIGDDERCFKFILAYLQDRNVIYEYEEM